jgi:murein L,D-transpeptidase YafK
MGMASYNGAAHALAIALATVVACAASAYGDDETPAAATSSPPARTASSGAADGLPGNAEAWRNVQIVVYKTERLLAVYRSGNFARQYPVVLGLEPRGRKRHAHDARTPEGLYHVVSSRRHARWQFFLSLDYPNEIDRRAYADELRRGRIPDDGGEPVGIGGAIGIHGTDREADQKAGVNWTKGCISLSARDVVELAAIVRAGSPVWIVE